MAPDSSQLAAMRRQYQQAALDEDALAADPRVQLQRWLDDAIAAQLPEPNAMVLATVDQAGQPSARAVLLKGMDDGLIFYSNYQSRKGQDIAHNARVALCFVWLPLERQVRIQGSAHKLTRAASEAYFYSRPRMSQLGALVSPQSRVIPNRAYLDSRWHALESQHPDTVPFPEHWGGYRVIPQRLEFWQGRSGRLHDRLCYLQQDNGQWIVQRLAP